MIDSDEAAEIRDEGYAQGSQMAWLRMLGECMRHLGYTDERVKAINWVLEREEAIHQLRSLCAEFGDTDWDNTLCLADIIDKHLGDYLRQR